MKSSSLSENEPINSVTFKDINMKILSGKMQELIFTNKGQTNGNREELFAVNATRKLTDPFIYTHIFLLISMTICFLYSNLELFSITLFTTILSVLYHHKYEKAGMISKLEGFSAKIMFLYGFFQIFYSPIVIITCIEIILMLTVIISFLITNLDHKLYDKYHNFGLHLIPAIWTILVAVVHKPFLF